MALWKTLLSASSKVRCVHLPSWRVRIPNCPGSGLGVPSSFSARTARAKTSDRSPFFQAVGDRLDEQPPSKRDPMIRSELVACQRFLLIDEELACVLHRRWSDLR